MAPSGSSRWPGRSSGTGASAIAAISNALYAIPNAFVHPLPAPATRPIHNEWPPAGSTSRRWCALVVGLFLHLAGPGPARGSRWVLVVSGPLLAFVGAALFTGSVLHPHNVDTGRTKAGLRRWLFLSGVRMAWLLPIAADHPLTGVAVVAVLSALGAPAFNPVQLAVLYRYRTADGQRRCPVGVVHVAGRAWW